MNIGTIAVLAIVIAVVCLALYATFKKKGSCSCGSSCSCSTSCSGCCGSNTSCCACNKSAKIEL